LKKTILLVGPVPPPYGGIPKYVNELLTSEFLNDNYSIELFNTAIPKNIRSYNKDNRRTYFSFMSDGFIPALKLIFYTLKNIFIDFPKSLRKVDPDIVQVFTSSYWGFWRNSFHVLLCRFFRIKVYFHLLNAIDDFWNNSSILGKSFISFFLNISDSLIVQSNGIKSFVQSISNTEVYSIYNGVNVDLYSKDNKFENNDELEFFNVVFVGAINKNKGVFDIINSIKFIKNKVKILMIGACDVNYFENICTREGVSNIYFKGSVSDEEKIEYLKHSQLFILPSYAEGQPLSILEAMASGLPIISTKVGSIPEIIIDKVNGFVIEPGDIRGLANYIDYFASNRLIRQKISANNLDFAKRLYNIERMIKDISNLYK
jgi:glycosyltransferase involved in cell wall biosynthesis